MGAVYRALLDRMLAEGWAPPRRARPHRQAMISLYLIVRCSVFG